MYSSSSGRLLALALSITAATAVAQQSHPAMPSPPASPAAGQFTYRSALQDYRQFADEKVAPWPASNETVRQIGGWRAYAREAAGADKEQASPDPHADHGAARGAKP
jgi:hypothetical protein